MGAAGSSVWAQPDSSAAPPRPQPPNRLPGLTAPVPGQGQQPAQQPRLPDPFPNRPRLPSLGVPQPLGKTPTPTPEVLRQQNEFIDGIIDPTNTLDLVVGRPRVIRLKSPPISFQLGDDTIAEATPINPREKDQKTPTLPPTELIVIGKQVGTTVLNLWFPDPKDPNKNVVLSYLVRVIPDPEAKERLERTYKALEQEINKSFPDSVVTLSLVGDKLVVCGQAKDIADATQILRIVRSNAPNNPQAPQNIPVRDINLNLNLDNVGPDGLPPNALEEFLVAGGPNVINLLRIPGEQQVQLRVTVAEVQRNAARSIGMDFRVLINNSAGGSAQFTQGTGGLLNGTNQNGLSSNLAAVLTSASGSNVNLAINALRTLGYSRTLAEPTLVALNGRPASFHAGGQFPVPVITGATQTGLQGVSFVPFGVQLTFTPYITDKDRIRLVVSAEVSAQSGNNNNQAQAATIGGAGGTVVPGLNTRNFQTTVEMREGQTFAVAGLIQNNLTAASQRVPYFGDLPYVGRMFGVDGITANETELVILVTPELVHPLEPKEVTPLPGSDLFEPGDIEFYLRGLLESRRTYDYRSPVRTDIDRMRAYRHCEQTYIVGPHGSSGPPQ
jgi:pilus assembly protein CpaC